VLTGRVKAIEIEGGPAIVVHYQGPYEQLGTAYAALNKWLEKHNKKAVEKPFESYLNDPDVVKDPWALRTDVYMLLNNMLLKHTIMKPIFIAAMLLAMLSSARATRIEYGKNPVINTPVYEDLYIAHDTSFAQGAHRIIGIEDGRIVT